MHLYIPAPFALLSQNLLRLEPRVCPDCEKWIGLAIPPFDRGLGPSTYLCKHCDCVAESGNNEWARFDRKDRQRYLMSALVLAIVIGGALTGLVFVTLAISGSLTMNHPATYLFSVFFLLAGSVAGTQGWRVFGSLQRDANGDLSTVQSSLISFETNVIVRLLVPVALAIGIFVVTFLC